MHRVIALGRASAALVAMVAMFLPWHVVRAASWTGTFCWGPDCRATPGAAPSYGPPTTCTGLAHGYPAAALLVLMLLAASALVSFRRLRLVAAVGVAVASALLVISLFYAVFDLAHLFDQVETRYGGTIFAVASATLALATAIDLVVTPLLYVWSRARLPRVPET